MTVRAYDIDLAIKDAIDGILRGIETRQQEQTLAHLLAQRARLMRRSR